MVDHIAVHIAMHVFKLHPDAWFYHEIAKFLLYGKIDIVAVVPANSVERPQIVVGICRGVYQGVIRDMIGVGIV